MDEGTIGSISGSFALNPEGSEIASTKPPELATTLPMTIHDANGGATEIVLEHPPLHVENNGQVNEGRLMIALIYEISVLRRRVTELESAQKAPAKRKASTRKKPNAATSEAVN